MCYCYRSPLTPTTQPSVLPVNTPLKRYKRLARISRSVGATPQSQSSSVSSSSNVSGDLCEVHGKPLSLWEDHAHVLLCEECTKMFCFSRSTHTHTHPSNSCTCTHQPLSSLPSEYTPVPLVKAVHSATHRLFTQVDRLQQLYAKVQSLSSDWQDAVETGITSTDAVCWVLFLIQFFILFY